ncbi:VCBS repeat-containing protein [Archangium gephyra]|uniref:FG-GAP repeat domain-containing protein n=1 Tax=Archangium gephyra TaxID=48 RepID=UPI0035D3F212
MAARSGWGKWARVGLLVSAGLYTGCGAVDAGQPEPAEPLPPENVFQPTPGEPPPAEPGPGPVGEGEQPGEPPVEPDTGSEGEPQRPPDGTGQRPRRAWLRASFYAGVGPGGLVAGDFNGDGSPDVAVNAQSRNFSSQYVTRHGEFLVLLNDGRGGLGKVAERQSLWSSSGRIAAGDANGDGHQDLLVGTRYGVDVRLGRGDGSFVGVEAKDVPSDGMVSSLGLWTGRTGTPLLWALGNYDDYDYPSGFAVFSLLRHAGEGRFEFSELRRQETGSEVVGFLESSLTATVADYNEDGFPDVVFNRLPSRWSGPEAGNLFFGDESGRVRVGGTLPWNGIRHVYTADFNRDGHADLLASDAASLRVSLGDGRGGFSESFSVEFEAEVSDVAVVQLDTDGLPDVVALHGPAEAVSLLRGIGDGTLVPHALLAVGRAPSAAATTDLDGDGTPELLVAEADDNTVSVYAVPDEPVREPIGPLTCPLEVKSGGASPLPAVSPLAAVETKVVTSDVTVGDFDGDSRRELALALPERGVRLVSNPGDGVLTVRDVAGSYRMLSLAAGDLDGDGRSDLAGTLDSGAGPYVGVLWNDVTEPFARSQSLGFTEGGGGVVAADFNRDGLVDVAAALIGPCTGRGTRFTNLGNGMFRPDLLTDHNYEPDDRCPGAGDPIAGDFNGDGTLDLLHTTLGINLNPTAADGTTLPGHGFERRFSSGPFLGVSDVDGDGAVDLVQQQERSGGVVLYRGDGHGSLQAPFQCAPPTGEKIIAVEDLDADGLPDVVSTSAEGTVLWVSLGTEKGRWGAPRRYEPGGQVEWVRPVDLLEDKRPELTVLLRSGRLLVFPTPGD